MSDGLPSDPLAPSKGVNKMLLQKTFLPAVYGVLIACSHVGVPIPAGAASYGTSALPLLTSVAAITPERNKADRADSSAHIWSLGGNGWALKIGQRMLVFDYVAGADATPSVSGEIRNLQKGYIEPDELSAFEVYVFVSHSHQDHFDPAILEWESKIDRITYFFGWQVGDNPEQHYMVGPRAHWQSEGVSVYTINSHHDGIPEVAYLVKVDGLSIYHNGDYRASYVEDFEYLKTITDHIDIAFVIGWPYVSHQHFRQAKALAETFKPGYMFAICREGDEDKSRQFAALLAEQGVESSVLYAKHRGDSFVCSRYAVE